MNSRNIVAIAIIAVAVAVPIVSRKYVTVNIGAPDESAALMRIATQNSFSTPCKDGEKPWWQTWTQGDTEPERQMKAYLKCYAYGLVGENFTCPDSVRCKPNQPSFTIKATAFIFNQVTPPKQRFDCAFKFSCSPRTSSTSSSSSPATTPSSPSTTRASSSSPATTPSSPSTTRAPSTMNR